MLTVTQSKVLMDAIAAAQDCKAPACKASAAALVALLRGDLDHKHNATTARNASRKPGKAGAPTVAYTVELEPDWRVTVRGAKAAHKLITETCAEHGPSVAGHAPSLGSMQVQLSRTGQWWRLLETSNGTKTLSVRRNKQPVLDCPEKPVSDEAQT